MWQSLKNIYHLCGAVTASFVYGFPSRKIKIIGVTGTDGKTTTSHMIYHVLKESGMKVSLTSSVYADVAGEISDTGLHVTTQSHWDIQKNLRKAVQHGDEFFVLETTSHGIDQHRNWGISYEASALTNVTNEHLDYHKTYEKYLATKVKLLLASKIAVVNKDDYSYPQVKTILEKHGQSFKTYSLTDVSADAYWDKAKISTHLDQDFNKQNLLAAYLICKEIGISEEEIRSSLGSFKLPKGRFELVYDGDFKVMIDFAHTPHSIRTLLQTLKKNTQGRIIHVFGSAGLRDYKKRPDMGKASAEYADIVIVTEEDYRTEDIDKINEAVERGFKERGFSSYRMIPDRQEAIKHAIELAGKHDVVVLTGKSHEKSIARGRKEYPWDEFEAVRNALPQQSTHKL